MNRTIALYSTAFVLGACSLLGLNPVQAWANGLEPVVWNSQQKSSAWAEELLAAFARLRALETPG